MTKQEGIVPTKRNFLKAFAFAPAAGVIAKQQLSSLMAQAQGLSESGANGAGLGLYNGAAQTIAPTADVAASWRQEIKWAREQIARVNSGIEHYRLPVASVALLRVEPLRSVSPTIKAKLLEREATQIEAQRRVGYFEGLIAHYKEKLGPIGDLID